MDKNTIVQQTVESVNKSQVAFSKFITANDAGVTGGHQSGFHLHKNSYPLFFDKPGEKGSNRDKFVRIKWQNDFETKSRFIYYGTGTRNEYRLTRFGKGFPFLSDDSVGNLLILCKIEKEYYEAFILSTDNEIEDFLNAFGLTPQETNSIIPVSNVLDTESSLLELFKEYILTLPEGFPSTIEVANRAREIIIKVENLTANDIKANPDKEILRWLNTEYQLFKAIENDRYSDIITTPFKTIDEFIKKANSVLNRRKSRAGKSLEHHLAKMFTEFELEYSEQPVTEGNKKPDFIFPSENAYRDLKFSSRNLIFLGAKTTCKDRWRQIINEADRIKVKHLFTLQQGVSSNQLKEMGEHNVKLVVPEKYVSAFPSEFRGEILTLQSFISLVDSTQK